MDDESGGREGAREAAEETGTSTEAAEPASDEGTPSTSEEASESADADGQSADLDGRPDDHDARSTDAGSTADRVATDRDTGGDSGSEPGDGGADDHDSDDGGSDDRDPVNHDSDDAVDDSPADEVADHGAGDAGAAADDEAADDETADDEVADDEAAESGTGDDRPEDPEGGSGGSSADGAPAIVEPDAPGGSPHGDDVDAVSTDRVAPGMPEPDPEPDTDAGGGWGAGGPIDDQEMPLTEHIEEMIRRLVVVVAVAGIVSLLVFPFAERIINFLWYAILPGTDIARPRLYGILELKLTELKVASLAGVIVALPVIVYETYLFMRPGLYPHERRYYLAAVPTSLVLALVGVSFAFFIVLPGIFTYFMYYSQDVATIGFALGRTFDLILLLMGYLAVVFQIPLFVMLAVMMGLTSRQWLADRRLIIWGSFLGISFLFSPDPTGMAPVVVALTMVALFEGTLLLLRWTGR